MRFEDGELEKNRKLKSAAEIEIEKIEKKPEEQFPAKETEDASGESGQIIRMEINIEKKDMEKIQEIGKEYGMDVSKSIAEKQKHVIDLESSAGMSGAEKREEIKKAGKESVLKEPVSKEKGIEYAKMSQESSKLGLRAREQLDMSRLELAEFILKTEISKANTEEDLKSIFRSETGKLELMMELNGGNKLYSNEKTYNAINNAFREKNREAIAGVTRTADLRKKVREILGV